MKIGGISDPHISYTSSITPLYCEGGKYTMRLQSIIDSFHWMYDLFDTLKVDLIVDTGDLVDRNILRSEELTALSEAFSYSKDTPEIYVTGNHDMLDNDHNFYASSILRNMSFVTVYNEPCKIDNNISVLPHMKPEDITPDILKSIRNKILFSHIDIKGSHLRSDYIMDTGVQPELLAENFNYTFNGHLHTAEDINTSKNCVKNVGSMMSISFSDSNSYIPSVYTFDTETHEFKRYDNPHAILFRKINVPTLSTLMTKLSDLSKTKIPHKYILRVTVPYSLREEAKHVIDKYNNVVAYRVVADIRSSVVATQEDTTVNKIVSDKGVDQDFVDFIESNRDILKYPIDKYKKILSCIDK
jgi:DNA repair exonuclease SbcCD nuclease subunit